MSHFKMSTAHLFWNNLASVFFTLERSHHETHHKHPGGSHLQHQDKRIWEGAVSLALGWVLGLPCKLCSCLWHGVSHIW